MKFFLLKIQYNLRG